MNHHRTYGKYIIIGNLRSKETSEENFNWCHDDISHTEWRCYNHFVGFKKWLKYVYNADLRSCSNYLTYCSVQMSPWMLVIINSYCKYMCIFVQNSLPFFCFSMKCFVEINVKWLCPCFKELLKISLYIGCAIWLRYYIFVRSSFGRVCPSFNVIIVALFLWLWTKIIIFMDNQQPG